MIMPKLFVRQSVAVAILGLALMSVAAEAQNAEQHGIGMITAVQGQVTVAHAGVSDSVPAKLRDAVLFHDVIVTKSESRTKALFQDDSILTVGENSRVEITEHLYDPNQNRRSMVVKLVEGQLRALVGKVFEGSGPGLRFTRRRLWRQPVGPTLSFGSRERRAGWRISASQGWWRLPPEGRQSRSTRSSFLLPGQGGRRLLRLAFFLPINRAALLWR